MMKNSISFNLIILLLLLLSTLPFGVAVSTSVLSKLQNDAKAINSIGYIRGSSQRLVKNIPLKQKQAIIKEVEHKFYELNTFYIVNNKSYLEQTDFSLHYQKLISIWATLRTSILENNLSDKELIELSENSWKTADNTANISEDISRLKYNESMLVFFAIGSFIFLLLIFTIILIYTKVKNTLEVNVIQDPLTKLYNRTHLLKTTEKTIKSFKRNKDPFSLLFIDIDHFKPINDIFGHSVGDKVLIDFSKLLQHFLREDDIAFRYGGEEFIVLVKHANASSSYILAERIRKNVETFNFSTEFFVTISLGISEYKEGDTIDDIINHADKMMYKAKAEGRNRTCIYASSHMDS